MSPRAAISGTRSGISLDCAILEDDSATVQEIMRKVGKIAHSINLKFKMNGRAKPVEVSKIRPRKLFEKNDERVFVQELKASHHGAFPDLVFLDNNLGGDQGTGLHAINEISKAKLPLDSILYSNVQNVVEPNQTNPYGRTWSSNYSDLEDVLESAITKFYLTWTNPEHIRGLILSRSADLDAAWNNLISSLLKLSNTKRPYFVEFALTRDGLDISRKAENASKVSKTMEIKRYVNTGWSTKIGNFKERTKKHTSTRNDFAHNLINGIGNDGRIRIRTKKTTTSRVTSRDGYGREEVKKFFVDVTTLINEMNDASSKIRAGQAP